MMMNYDDDDDDDDGGGGGGGDDGDGCVSKSCCCCSCSSFSSFCLVVWLFGCLVVWLSGCLVVWLFGCLVVWLLLLLLFMLLLSKTFSSLPKLRGPLVSLKTNFLGSPMVDLLKSSLSAPIKRIQKHLSKAMELQAGRRSYCGRHEGGSCGSYKLLCLVVVHLEIYQAIQSVS